MDEKMMEKTGGQLMTNEIRINKRLAAGRSDGPFSKLVGR